MKTNFNHTHRWALPALSVLFSFIVIVSCQKTESTSSPQTTNTQLNSDLTNSTNFLVQSGNWEREDFADMTNTEKADGSSNFQGADGSCRTVTFDVSENVYPHTKTIVSNNCTKCDGSTANGTQMITYYVDPQLAKPGDLLSRKTYQDFTVDDARVMGTVSTYLVSNEPYVLRGFTRKTIIVPGPNGGRKIFISRNVRTRIAGGNTTDESDDVYAITGTSTGIINSQDGGQISIFTSVIDPNHPIINSNDCCWSTQGITTTHIVVRSNPVYVVNASIDFGDGTCDNQATLTTNDGHQHAVTLPLQFFPFDNGD